MSITDKLSNSFLINYHQPHSGRNLITLFSLNYHQSLCQQWFIFQEGPPLKPPDIVFFFFTSPFLPRWKKASFVSSSNFLQFLPHWSLHMKTLKLVVNGGCDLTWRDKMAASNQILKTNSTAFWLRSHELLLCSYCQCLYNIIVNILGL